MQIIQNLEAIQLVVKSDQRINFPVDSLQDKEIDSLILFNPYEPISSPYTNVGIWTLGRISGENYYLNCIDNKGNHFIQDALFSKNILFDTSSLFHFNINRVIDLRKSFIRTPKRLDTTEQTILMLATYKTQPLQPFSDKINGAISCMATSSFPANIYGRIPFADICFKDFCPNSLRGKKIKRIMVRRIGSQPFLYLDIVGRDGKIIRNIPGEFLQKGDKQDFWFDNIDIDYDKSFLRLRAEIVPYYPNETSDPGGDPTGPDDIILTNVVTELTFLF